MGRCVCYIKRKNRPLDLAIEDEGFTSVVGKHHVFAEKLYQHMRFKTLRTNHDAPEAYIRIGPPGTGKSRWADDEYGRDKCVEAPDNLGRWFECVFTPTYTSANTLAAGCAHMCICEYVCICMHMHMDAYVRL